MALLKLKPGGAANDSEASMNGREYFERAEKELEIEDLDPAALQEKPKPDLKTGSKESRLGGRITRNLKQPSPEEVAERRKRAERFLEQPEQYFPAEDAASTKTKSQG